MKAENISESSTKSNYSHFLPEGILESKFLKSYVIDEKNPLGHGSYGTVFSAKSHTNGNYYAIKIFHTDSSDDFHQKSNEIMINGSLKHSHIVKIIDFSIDTQTKQGIIVMEKGDMSLKTLLKGNKLDREYLLQLILDVSTGLKYAHEEKHITHLDIKPGNIIIFKNIDRNQKTDTQKIFLKEKTHIFKLADWGEAKLAGSKLDHTTLCKTDIGGTPNYAAPEILSHINQEENAVNFGKADIYSFGLCILACCGGNCDEFRALNNIVRQDLHSKYLKSLMKSYDIKKNYGENIFYIIKKMVQFKSSERITITEIFELLNQIICLGLICNICDKTHSKILEMPNCKHVFGKKCVVQYYETRFENNELYIPKCQFCKITIDIETIKEIMSKDLYKKYYSKCRLCKMVSFKKVITEMKKCNHKLCHNCLKNTLKEGYSTCPIMSCEENLGKSIKKEFEKIKKKCFVCDLDFEDFDNEPIRIPCCKMRICKECLKTQINLQIKDFSTERINQLFCIVCRTNLKKSLIQEVLGESGYKNYMKKYQKKEKCKNCGKFKEILNFEDLDCPHKICSDCLQPYILYKFEKNPSKKILCIIENCDIKLSSEIIKKYTEKIQKKNINENEKTIINSKIQKEIQSPPKEELKLFTIIKSQQGESKIGLNCKECRICYESYPEIEFLELECAHKFCKKCLKTDWTLKIINGQVHQNLLICPKAYCHKSIKYNFLKKHLDPKIFKKYDEFLLEYTLYNQENTGANERMIMCPMKNCGSITYVWQNASYFECNTCKNQFCANEACKGDWKLHNLLTCEQFRNFANLIDESNRNFDKKFKKCPKCGILIEIISNYSASYVRCISIKCQRNTIFCNTCGIRLNEKLKGGYCFNCNSINNEKRNNLIMREQNEEIKGFFLRNINKKILNRK